MINSSKLYEARDEFMKQAIAENFEELVNQYFLSVSVKKPGIMQRGKRKVKRILHKKDV